MFWLIALFCNSAVWSNSFSYRLIKFSSSTHRNNQTKLNLFEEIHRNSTHFCNSREFYNFTTTHAVTHNHLFHLKQIKNKLNFFDSVAFLNLIRGRKLGIFGDSIALQMFHSIVNHLLRYETSEVKVTTDGSHPFRNYDFSHKIANYEAFNTSKTTNKPLSYRIYFTKLF
jgi:hypothetical protein